MTYDEKDKRKSSTGQRRSILIVETVVVVVALIIGARVLFDDDTSPANSTAVIEVMPTVVVRQLTANEFFERGREFYTAGDYEAAISDLTMAIERGYTRADGFYQRGLAYYYNSDYQAAIGDYTEAIERAYTPITSAYFERARAHYALESYENALADYNRSIASDPDCEHDCDSDYNNRGITYAALNNYEAAIEDYNRSLQYEPDDPLTTRNRARAYDQLGEVDKALADWDTALRLAEQTAIPYRFRDGNEATSISGLINGKGVQVHATFDGQAGDHIILTITEADFDTLMILRGPDGEALIHNDDASNNTLRSLIAGYDLPQDGQYTVVIAAHDDAASGEFELDLRRN